MGYHFMVGRYLLGIVALCSACSAHLGEVIDNNMHTDAPAVMPDGPEMLGPWSTPTAIPGADDPVNNEDDCTANSTATEIIYGVQPPAGNKDLYVITRPTTSDPWSTPTALTVLNTTGNEESPRLSPNDLTLYFGRDGDIYTSTRMVVGGTWSTPTMVASVSVAGQYEKWLAVCNGGNVMVSRDIGTGNGQDLYEGTLTGGATIADDILNSTSAESSTFLSTDCLTVYFASGRGGPTQIYMATRTSIPGTWSAPVEVGSPFSDGTDDEDPWVSVDQRTFVFAGIRGTATTKDLYISTR